MMFGLRVGLSLLVVACACARDASDRPADAQDDAPAETTSGAEARNPDQFIACEGLEDAILRTSAQREPMRGTFGRADSVRSTTEPNRHVPEVIDSLFVAYYPGLTAEIRKPHRGTDMPVRLHVTDNRYLRYPQVGIGVPSEDVVRLLGNPTSRDAASLSYDCGVGAEQPVIFHISAGKVSSVEIQYYVD